MLLGEFEQGGGKGGGFVVSAHDDFEVVDVLELALGSEVGARVLDGDCIKEGLPLAEARTRRSPTRAIL